jgi:uncharacterized membrane protein SpoIIM required for sporulation
MTLGVFVRKNRPHWKQLEEMLALMERRAPESKKRAFLQQLSATYRITTGDLAFAQTHFRGTTLLIFLHQLVARAHNQIYRSRPISLAEFIRFFRQEIPNAVRRHLVALSWAALVFLTGVMLGLSAVQFDEQAASIILPTRILDAIYSGRMWTGPIFSVLPAPVASTYLFTNNISVALLAFAGGLSFGIISFWFLFLNGVMLGVVFKLCANYGLLGALLAFIATHGFLEISAILVSGAAGFVVANALLRPGDYARSDALSIQARSAVRMAVASVPALIVSGCLEAFISPSTLPIGFKIAIGLAIALSFWLYLLFTGKKMPDAR